MSIILKALRKVQHQNSRQPSDSSAPASGKRGEGVRDVSAASISTPSESKSRADASAGTLTRKSGSRMPAASRQAAGGHRFGNVPKLLLGVVVAVGMFATGWFLNRIYSNLAPVADTREIASQADAAKVLPLADATRTIAAEARPVSSAVSQPVAGMPGEMASPIGGAVAGVPAASPQVARASAVVSPQQPSAPAPVAEPSVRAATPTRSPEPEPTSRVEKEAKPAEPEKPKFKINAIAWRAVEPKAIVNMQRVYVGDVIEGATVLAIRRTSVIFEFEGETFEVRF